jgi:hypothetical protein
LPETQASAIIFFMFSITTSTLTAVINGDGVLRLET